MRHLIQEIKNLFHDKWSFREPEQGQIFASYSDAISQHTYRALFIIEAGYWTMLTKDADLRDDVYNDLKNEPTAYRFNQQVLCCLTTNPKLVIICEDCGGQGGFRKAQKIRLCYSCKGVGYQLNPLLGMKIFDS